MQIQTYVLVMTTASAMRVPEILVVRLCARGVTHVDGILQAQF